VAVIPRNEDSFGQHRAFRVSSPPCKYGKRDAERAEAARKFDEDKRAAEER